MEKVLTSAITWSFLDNLSEGIIVAESDGSIQYINQAAKLLLGLEQEVHSLARLCQLVAPHERWQILLNPLAELHLRTAEGFVTLKSQVWQGMDSPLFQILVNPTPLNRNHSDSFQAIEQLTALTRISSEPDFDRKLQLIVNGLQMTGWNRVVLTLRDLQFNPTKIITAGFTQAERQFLQENLLPAEVWRNSFNSDEFNRFRRGACYFVPAESDWARQNLSAILADYKTQSIPGERDSWQPHDLLCVPMYDRQQHPIGLLSLDQPHSGRRPDARTLQIIELYAQFAASIIENGQLVAETLARSQEFELLFEASHALFRTLEKDTVLTLMGEHLVRAGEADGYTIYQWKENNTLTILKEDSPGLKVDSPRPEENSTLADIATTVSLEPGDSVLTVINKQQPVVVHHPDHQASGLQRPTWLASDEPYTSILLPIVLSEETYGLIEIITRGVQPTPSSRHLSLLTTLSNQANAALETALIFEDTYEREQFYNAVGSVSLAINYTSDLETVLNLICSESLRIFNVDGAYIWQRDEAQFIGSAAKGHGEEAFVGTVVPLTETNAFVTTIASKGEATYINNINQTPAIHLKLPQRELVKAALGVPLEQEGNIVGVLILVDKQRPDRFSYKDVARAAIFGVQAAIAMQNAKLFEELRRFNEELDLRVAERTRALHEESTRVNLLLRITTELSASLDEDRVLNQALHLVNEVVNATQGVILLVNQETGEMVFRSAFGIEHTPPPRSIASGLLRDEGLAGWVIENRSPVIVHDTRIDPRWQQPQRDDTSSGEAEGVGRIAGHDHRSVLAVPLITGEDVIGVLMLFHIRPNAFTMQQLDLVEAAAIQVANAINNANLYQLIREQAERLGTMLHLEQIETAKNQAILESIADGVIVADARHRVMLANLHASSILGIPREELINKSINEFLGLYGPSRQSWLATMENWAENADLIEGWTYLDDQLTIEDKVVSVHLSPVLAGKQFFGTVSIFRDITKEVEVDRLKSEFVSTVSHELRTPMTSIKGYVDLMLMGAAGTMSNPQIRYLKVIKNNAERLHMLVNDLLNISRIETGKTTLDLRPVDISHLVEQVIDGHLRGRIQSEEKNIRVVSEIPDSLPLVNGDHARVTQVLTNLLDNAFNYTPEDGEIRVSAHASGKFVYINVTDTGIGISKENQAKIFDRFFRAEDEAVQKVPGTGLGLAIVRSLVEMHGGRLEVQSKPGAGSAFTFNLPVVVEDSEPAQP